MSLKLLAVDADVTIFGREQPVWSKHGFDLLRADSMRVAIELSGKEDFALIVINADNINYLPQLRILHDISAAPIFIICSNFSAKKQVEALSNGADLFDTWLPNGEDNIASALALLDKYNTKRKQEKRNVELFVYGDLLLTSTYHKVFNGDIEIPFSKTEFDILHYLMLNRNRVITYDHFFELLSENDAHESSHQALWAHIKRIRKNLKTGGVKKQYIVNVRKVGYKFIVS